MRKRPENSWRQANSRGIWRKEEPRKQNPRRCRAQELARSSARENEWQKEGGLLNWDEQCGIGRAM
jgi:hypothetical protein